MSLSDENILMVKAIQFKAENTLKCVYFKVVIVKYFRADFKATRDISIVQSALLLFMKG